MDILREIVGGPKHRFKENGYNLDLTYITDRIIAMAFPASGLEKLYRNSIDAVREFLDQRHPEHYLIINISGRDINEQKLHNVECYEWQDHCAPPIDTLFIITHRMYTYLTKHPKNIVVVHCNHGKGRTGTIICCFLLFSGRIKKPEEAQLYYAKKRFQQEGMGVTQPCQIRYIQYFQDIITTARKSPTVVRLQKIILTGSHKISTPYVKVKDLRTMHQILTTKSSVNLIENIKLQNTNQILIKVNKETYFSGDVMLLLNNEGFIGDKKIARICFNTAFIPQDNKLVYKLEQISPDSLIKSGIFQPDFYITLYFQSYCKCPNNIAFNLRCFKCRQKLLNEEQPWRRIYKILEKRPEDIQNMATFLLFDKTRSDDIDSVLKYQEK